MTFEALLEKFRSLYIEDSINYELMSEILISHHSTAIEGSTLSEEESRLLIIEGLTAKGKPITHHLMVQDHYNALVEIVELSKNKHEINPGLIQNINANVMKNTGCVINTALGSFDSSKGEWRKVNVHAGTRTFVSYQKVESLVKILCDDLQDRIVNLKTVIDIYDLAFNAHYSLVSIHPFADGNGRTSRLLMNYILAYHKMPLAIVFKEERLDYINALEESRKQETTEPFKLFMYDQQRKYLQQEIDKTLQQDYIFIK
ncbi:MAG: Fic family protein [Bacteroidales bacterium]|jgi:Fic family protein|nr:Fic family protein [Bacteroidales bacterium]